MGRILLHFEQYDELGNSKSKITPDVGPTMYNIVILHGSSL